MLSESSLDKRNIQEKRNRENTGEKDGRYRRKKINCRAPIHLFRPLLCSSLVHPQGAQLLQQHPWVVPGRLVKELKSLAGGFTLALTPFLYTLWRWGFTTDRLHLQSVLGSRVEAQLYAVKPTFKDSSLLVIFDPTCILSLSLTETKKNLVDLTEWFGCSIKVEHLYWLCIPNRQATCVWFSKIFSQTAERA